MKMKKTLLIAGVVLAGGLLGIEARAQSSSITPAQLDFFEKKIRPVLADACYKCHSQQQAKNRGGLVVDTKQGLLKGGDSGPSIVPGNPDKSLLIKAVRYTDPDMQMPPKGEKLSDAQIADLEAWVKMGAPDPREGSIPTVSMKEIAQSHWAFQPVSKPVPPAVKNRKWVQTPVDSFILAKLEEKDLTPSPQADKRSLIRRATYDLTGLPPSMEEFEAFMADNSANAYEKVIDRLLKSPHYGERWGRYWLDIARYADSKGDVNQNREDHRYPYAWTYRDYVIKAFNDDKPYDQFIIEQLAADKLPLGNDKSALAALGFLTVGKRFGNNSNEIIDDRIDAVSKGFLGLTVSCARCHDHKFDPIPTADYYSLHGIFASSTEPQEGPLLRSPAPTPEYQQFMTELTKLENEVKAFRDKVETDIRTNARAKASEYMLVYHEVTQPGNTLNRNLHVAQKKLDNGIFNRWNGYLQSRRNRHDPIFTPWFEFSKLSDKEFPTLSRALATKFYQNKEKDKPINMQVARMFASAPTSMQDLADRYGKLFAEADRQWQSLVDVAARTRRPEPTKFPEPNWEAVRQVLYGNDAPPNPTGRAIDGLMSQQLQRQETQIHSKIISLKMTHSGSPGRAMVLQDITNPRDSRIFIRGNASSPGDVAPRRFLEALSDDKREPFKNGSGRLELAQAIASKQNPLTARVMANRVWLHHFGEGIVRTPHDFGTRSEPPTHPELLNYLAATFMENGWSVKKLHKMIMLSSAYQQASDDNPRFAQIDPSNQLLWRQNVRRLDFEALRDTMLAIGGKLDMSVGGAPVDLTREPYPTRRTIYGMVDRRNLATVFRTFDFADPDLTTGQRYQTTVPQQALFLMNNALVIEQARNLVARPDFLTRKSDEERVALLYKLIYQRQPNPTETKLALRFLESQSGMATEAGEEPVWLYGHGEFDTPSRQIKNFQTLSSFTRNTWTGGPQGLFLDANGGHPGPSPREAAIRRWIAPVDGVVDIEGAIAHKDKRGDGVVARIVSSNLGELRRFVAFNNQAETKLNRIPVKRGDTIDFVVECLKNSQADAFTWTPTIKMTVPEGGAPAGTATVWSAKNEFKGTNRPAGPKPLSSWEKYAQVLLQTNEMTFFN